MVGGLPVTPTQTLVRVPAQANEKRYLESDLRHELSLLLGVEGGIRVTSASSASSRGYVAFGERGGGSVSLTIDPQGVNLSL